MSHYAKLVKQLHIALPGDVLTLPIGTQIKRVRLQSGGVYAFDALLGGRWSPLLVDADLPAFTDKGQEQRANGRKRPTLAKGRPKSNAPPTQAGGLRMRHDQWAALDAGCDASETTRNEVIVGALILAGLVPQ